MNILLNRVKQLLYENHMTQVGLAEAIGITQATLSRNLNAVHAPRVEVIDKIADYFHVSTDYLLGRSDVRNTNLFKKELNSALDSNKYEPTHLSDEELDANLEELLSRTTVRFEGRKLTKAEIKAIINTAKEIVALREDK